MWSSIVFTTPLVASDLAVRSVLPEAGSPGTRVAVSIPELPSDASVTVQINGTPVDALQVESERVLFETPESAESGPLTLSVDGHPLNYGEPFFVKRRIPGVFNPPPGVSMEGYRVATGNGATDPLGSSGAFEAIVPQKRATLVWAFRQPEDPTFLALATSSDDQLTIDARSTAIALVFSTPVFATDNDAAASALRTYLREDSGIDAMADRIATLSPGGEYVDDPQLLDRWAAIATDILQEDTANTFSKQATAASIPGQPQDGRVIDSPTGTFLKMLNDEPITLSTGTFEASLKNGAPDHPGHYTFDLSLPEDPDMASEDSTPLDWSIVIYELDAFQFANGLEDIENLNSHSTPEFESENPVRKGYFPAVLESANIDIVGTLAGKLWGFVAGAGPDTLGSNEFLFEADQPGIYMAHATSGNVFYGTRAFLSDLTNQDPLIREVDVGNQWGWALGTNSVLSAIDFASLLVDAKELYGFDDANYVYNQTVTVAKAVTQLLDEDLGPTEVAMILKNTTVTLVKTFVENQVTQIDANGKPVATFGTTLAENLGGSIFKTLASSIDILNKIATVGKSVERSGNLFSPNTLALERSVFVIGDPFVPVVTAIDRKRARTGDVVVIEGRNFPFNAEELTVSLCQFEQTDVDAATVSASLEAEVLDNSTTAVAFRVPDGWRETFSLNEAYICVEEGNQRGTSRRLGQDGLLQLIPPPELTAVTPENALIGGKVTIEGERFAERNWRDNQVLIDGDPDTGAAVAQATGDELTVILPPNLEAGEHTLSVRLKGDPSNTLSFSAQTPLAEAQPGDTQNGGRIINVTVTDFSDAFDGEISILEAFRIANGSRGIEEHLPCEFLDPSDPGHCEFQQREIDFVTEFDPTRIGDLIMVNPGNDPIVLPSPLPKLNSGDSVQFGGGILDGSGITGPGVDFSALSDVSFSNATLSGFSGHGVDLSDARHAFLRDITIEASGGDAIHIGGPAHDVSLVNITARNAGRDGINIGGTDIHTVEMKTITIENPGRHGVHVTGGNMRGISLLDGDVDNPGGHGLYFTGSIARSLVGSVEINNAVESGLFLENAVRNSRFRGLTIRDCGRHAVRLDGQGVRHNQIYQTFQGNEFFVFPFDAYTGSQNGYGLLLEGGAAFNIIAPGTVANNAAGGIALRGAETSGNVIGPRGSRAVINPELTHVFDNDGHGVHLSGGASGNRFHLLNVAGNQGDGVRVEGADSDANTFDVVWTGLRFDKDRRAPVAASNTGHGIHLRDGASDNLIGSHQRWGEFAFRNSLVNNDGDGIRIDGEGTDRNTVNRTSVGDTNPAFWYFDDADTPFTPNGVNGIALSGGASENTIGDVSSFFDVDLFASPGAAILIEGEGTDGNTVPRASIGIRPTFGEDFANAGQNGVGVHIRDGAAGNIIGRGGQAVNLNVEPFTSYEFGCEINFVADAGVILENTGGSVDPDGNLMDPNVIQGNTFGDLDIVDGDIVFFGNPVGIRIRDGARANRIGGPAERQGNAINYSERRGIEIIDNPINDPALRNRFQNNSIRGANTDLPATPGDPGSGPSGHVGILVTGNSGGNIIGEGRPTSNRVSSYHTGVDLDAVSGVTIHGMQIFGSQEYGVIVRGGSDHAIGGKLPDTGNDISTQNTGEGAGIRLDASDTNTIRRNEITDNDGHGIHLVDAADNRIGGSTGPVGNFIGGNGRAGIRIEGTASSGNTVNANRIGLDAGSGDAGNAGAGIVIADGASGNTVGAKSGPASLTAPLPAAVGNTIAHNDDGGVVVDGGATNGNTILSNRIYDSGDRPGIALLNGGNDALPAPVQADYSGRTITGAVTDNALLPPGSVVQVFSDRDAEGEVLLGQGRVRTGGTWTIAGLPAAPYPDITLTATNVTSGSTSEFGTDVTSRLGFEVNETDDQPSAPDEIRKGGRINSVLALQARAVNAAVRVKSLTVTLGGSADLTQVEGVYLFRDVDGDHRIGADDTPLAGPVAVDSASGEATFFFTDTFLRADSTRRWLLGVKLTPEASVGADLSVAVELSEDVPGNFLYQTDQTILPSGSFPLDSPDFSIAEAIKEFLIKRIDVAAEGGSLEIEITGPAGEDATLQSSPDLEQWTDETIIQFDSDGSALETIQLPSDLNRQFYRGVID